MRSTITIAALLMLAAIPARAQDDARAEVLATVTKLFDGMRARDTAALAQIFDPGARLVTTFSRNGQPAMETTPATEFIKLVTTVAPGQLLDERIEDPKVDVEDNLASVWVKYRFYVGTQFSHCGIDAMHLAKSATGWKIIALADTRRQGAACGSN